MCLNLVLRSSRISKKPKKDDLLACLHRKKILTEEEEWLDNAPNPVDDDVDDNVVNKKKPTRKEALTTCIHPWKLCC